MPLRQGVNMDIEFTQETQQQDAHRTCYEGTLSYGGSATPKRYEVAAAAAKKLKTEPSLIVIESIRPIFGSSSSHITIYAYNDKKQMSIFEQEYRIKRDAAPEKPAEEEQKEAPAEAKKEETTEGEPAEKESTTEAASEEGKKAEEAAAPAAEEKK
jgi:ribosomal protein S24E